MYCWRFLLVVEINKTADDININAENKFSAFIIGFYMYS